MCNNEAALPRRKIRHFDFKWMIGLGFDSLNELQNYSSILGAKLKVDPEDDMAGTWQLGISEEKKELHVYIELTDGPSKIFVNMKVTIKFPGFPECLTKYSRWIQLGKKLKFTFRLPLDYLKMVHESSSCRLVYNNYWRVYVEFLYHQNQNAANEPIQNIPTKGPSGTIKCASRNECYRQVGIDLSKCFLSERYADMKFELKCQKFPVHEAIIHSRFPLILERFRNGPLIFKCGIHALFYFLLFLYSGNIDTLVDVGTLPIGLCELAKDFEATGLYNLLRPELLMNVASIGHLMLAYKVIVPIIFDRNYFIRPPALFPYQEAKHKLIFFIYKPRGNMCHSAGSFLEVQVKRLTDTPIKFNLEVEYEIHDEELRRKCFPIDLWEKRSAETSEAIDLSSIAQNAPVSQVGFRLTLRIILEQRQYVTGRIHTLNPIVYNGNPAFEVMRERINFDIDYDSATRSCIRQLKKDFRSMRNSMMFSDLKLQFRDSRSIVHSIDAHKVMIAARSRKLSNMLRGLEDSELLLTDINEAVQLDALVSEIYTGYAKLNKDNAADLYKVALAFNLQNLKRRFIARKSKLCQEMTFANNISVLTVATDKRYKQHKMAQFIRGKVLPKET